MEGMGQVLQQQQQQQQSTTTTTSSDMLSYGVGNQQLESEGRVTNGLVSRDDAINAMTLNVEHTAGAAATRSDDHESHVLAAAGQLIPLGDDEGDVLQVRLTTQGRNMTVVSNAETPCECHWCQCNLLLCISTSKGAMIQAASNVSLTCAGRLWP